MSLIDDLAKIPLNDPASRVGQEPLTKEEKLSLSEMFRSPSWDLMTTKVWPQALKQIVVKALTVQVDQRYFQGMFMGYKNLIDSAIEFKGGFDEKIATKLQDNLNDLY